MKLKYFCHGKWPLIGLSLLVVVLTGCASSRPAPVRNGTPVPPVATPPANVSSAQFHVVRPGDTLMGISRLYGQNVNDLVVWNSLMDPNQLQVGQEVRVAPPSRGSGAVAIAQPVEVRPVVPGGTVAAAPPVKHEPRGGKQPYTDQAWAAMKPVPVAPQPPAGAPPTATPAPQPDAAWLWPASGAVIAGFSEASNKGVDIAGKPGDPVIASAAGKVVYSGAGLRGYGKLVILKHDDQYLTAYAHNQNLLVKEGDEVSKGQRIAELGSTDADRPKLHFEIRRQGRPVDPMQYLPSR
jgi:lipoprotein NlpD